MKFIFLCMYALQLSNDKDLQTMFSFVHLYDILFIKCKMNPRNMNSPHYI